MRNPLRRRETKSFDSLPEGLWQQMVAAQDTGNGPIGLETAVGLPAILAVVRFLAHAAALVPIEVVRAGEVTERAVDSWQWNLLHKRPGPPPTTPFNFKADLAANFVGRGNAYTRKIKPSSQSFRMTREAPRVTELMSLYAAGVKPKRSATGAVVFMDSTGDKPVERGTDEIIHMRSFSVAKDGLTGVSPITAARHFVSAGLRRQQFEDRHLSNGIFPSVAVNFPRGMSETQAERWLDFIEGRHKGSGRAGKAIGVPDGANLTALPVSLEDALFAEMTRLTLEQACAMYQIPPLCVLAGRNGATDDDYRHMVTWALGPVLQAMAEGFQADDDLFKPGEDDDLEVAPQPDALLKLDALKKAQVQREQIQTGARLVDELRAQDGYAPLPPIPDDWTKEPGKVPQITPVGGAPNPTVSTGTPSVPEGGPHGSDQVDA